MRAILASTLFQSGPLVMSGSLATALEERGCDLHNSLWTAKVLAEQPEMVKEVHLAYLRAGADCGLTCSYQASIAGFLAQGYTREQAEELLVSSVSVFQEARQEWWQEEGKAAGRAFPLCLAGIGPYGAYLADGSEYSGHYGVTNKLLREFHQRRAQVLWEAGADLLLFETQPSLNEALIEADIAEKLGAPYGISFSCRDGLHTNEGDLILECAKTLNQWHPNLQMVGANCTRPEYMSDLIRIFKDETSLPVAVYPCRKPDEGEEQVCGCSLKAAGKPPVTKGETDTDFYTWARKWYQEGASLVGGCCGTSVEQVKAIVRARDEYKQQSGSNK